MAAIRSFSKFAVKESSRTSRETTLHNIREDSQEILRGRKKNSSARKQRTLDGKRNQGAWKGDFDKFITKPGNVSTGFHSEQSYAKKKKNIFLLKPEGHEPYSALCGSETLNPRTSPEVSRTLCQEPNIKTFLFRTKLQMVNTANIHFTYYKNIHLVQLQAKTENQSLQVNHASLAPTGSNRWKFMGCFEFLPNFG